MAARIVTVDPAAEHRDRRPARLEGAPVGLPVDSPCHAADDHHTGQRELPCELAGDLSSVGGAAPGADDRHGGLREYFDGSPSVETRRRVVQLRKQGRIAAVPAPDGPHLHAANSLGDRYDRASATCSGEAVSSPARAAAVAATRATFAFPRAESGSESTARSSSWRALRERLGASRAAAASTLSLTAADGSPGAPSSPERARGTTTTRSKRSRRARESLSRYEASRWGEHEHSAAGSPRAPQGQRFIVPTSWIRAGKTHCPWTREIATNPSSSGCRSASRAGR
jgi:hypothetical protein